VPYLRAFGPEAYFVSIPSKFIAPDGLTAWLCYSANFAERVERTPPMRYPSKPEGSRYGMCLHEFRIETCR
jgi:hypothetical protein